MCFRASKMDQTQLCAWIGSVTSTPNPSNNVKISQSIIEIRLKGGFPMLDKQIKGFLAYCKVAGFKERSIKTSSLRLNEFGEFLKSERFNVNRRRIIVAIGKVPV